VPHSEHIPCSMVVTVRPVKPLLAITGVATNAIKSIPSISANAILFKIFFSFYLLFPGTRSIFRYMSIPPLHTPSSSLLPVLPDFSVRPYNVVTFRNTLNDYTLEEDYGGAPIYGILPPY